MIKQLSNVLFYIVIALKLVYTVLLMHVPLIRLKFYSGIFRLFRIVKNRKFRENVVTARAESIFSVYGKMFSLCVCNSATDLLQFHETDLLYLGAQVHRMRNSIGLCCTVYSSLCKAT